MHEPINLLLDIGNSRMKWNLWQHGAEQFSQETRHVDYKAKPIDRVLSAEWGKLHGIQDIYIANVAGQEVAQQINHWTHSQWNVEPKYVATSASFQSVTNGYRRYQELGVDRWLAVIAAQQLCLDQQVIIIDCGTAITVDALNRDGQHHAGPILPGRQMMLQSLSINTADLKIPCSKDSWISVFAENTENAITSGVNFATSSALNTIVAQMRQKLLEEAGIKAVSIVVTGGAAKQLLPLTEITDFKLVPDLVLMGLRRVAELNQ